jgi:ATP:ADP antiporter, AAA family
MTPPSITSKQNIVVFQTYITATIMIAHQVAGKATRDGLFLTSFEVTDLPKAVMASALLSFFAVLLMSQLLRRHSPARVVPIGYGISALLFTAEWYYFVMFPKTVVALLYLHMATFGAVLISGFWSIVNERFDPYTAKRTVARIAAAATLGGLLGGILTHNAVSLWGSRTLLLVLAGMQFFCCIALFKISQGTAQNILLQPVNGKTGIHTLVTTPYLRQMAYVIVLVAIIAALLDYSMKAQAADYFTSNQSLTGFFAAFYAITGLLTFLLQTVFGPKMLKHFGLAGTMSFLPGAVLISGILGTAVLHLWTVTILRAAESIFFSSFFRSAFELLYTPLSPEKKRPTKIIIDVGSNRIGDLLGAGLLLILLAFIPELPISLIISIAMAVSGIAIFVITQLQAGYVSQLAESLHSGAVSLQDVEVVDATTRLAIRGNKAISDREILQAKIRDLQQTELSEADLKNNHEQQLQAIEKLLKTTCDKSQLILAIFNLTSDNYEQIRQTLNGKYMDTSLVPFILPLLSNSELVDECRIQLRWLAPQTIGLLTDALTNPDTDTLVRIRIPEVMEVCHNQRTVDGLMAGMTDSQFAVRHSCARTLARMLLRGGSLTIHKDQVFTLVERELTINNQQWNAPDLSLDVNFDNAGRSPDASTSLHHVFIILSLALDHQAIDIARQALLHKQSNLEGTALEYLENVLPDSLRRLLWFRLNLPISPL